MAQSRCAGAYQFYDLHQVIQTVFEWEDAHMHIFEAPKDRFEIVTNARDAYTDYFLEEKISVSAIAERESWVRYVYDMGDDWRHKLTFEKEWKTMTKIMHFYGKRKGTVLQRIPAVSGMANK